MNQPLDLGHLLTEQRNPASLEIDTLSTLDLCRVMNEQDRGVAEAVGRALPAVAEAIDAIAAALAAGGRLFYIGAGTSGRLGVLDASECPPTFNVPPEMVIGLIAGGDTALRHSSEGVEDSPEAGARDLEAHAFSSRDVLCGIAASGRTPYVLGAMEAAKRLGAVTIGVACSPASPLAAAAGIAIEVLTGPEVLTGSTRLKAGTATKLVLNMLSTGAMIRLGYVYSNLMINVQPSNEKLVDRAQRILMAATGVSRAEAARALKESGRNVRTALVMAARRVTRAQAEALLAAAGGRVRDALTAPLEENHVMNHSPEFLALVNEARTRVRETNVGGYRELRAAGEPHVLIDVREESEYAAGHIPGSIHLGKGIIERDIIATVPDKNSLVVLYCGGGFRSVLAADNLQKMGYTNVVSMDGGWRAWNQQGHEIER